MNIQTVPFPRTVASPANYVPFFFPYSGVIYPEDSILTVNATDATRFDISAGKAQCISVTTDRDQYTRSIFSWTAQVGVLSTLRSTNVTVYIGIESDGTVVQQATAFTRSQMDSVIKLGHLRHDIDAGEISVAYSFPKSACTESDYAAFVMGQGTVHMQGLTVTANATDNLTIDIASGLSTRIGVGIISNGRGLNFAADAGVSPLTGILVTKRDTAAQATKIEASQDTVDVTHYDTGSGTLSTIQSGYYSKSWILYFPGKGGASRTVLQILDSVEHSSLIIAQLVDTGPPTLPDTQNGVLLCRIICRQDQTQLVTALAGGLAEVWSLVNH